MKLLIADDHEANRKLLKTVFAADGFDVVEARDGVETWSMLDSSREPLVGLIDWEMPGLSGLEVCERVRQRATPERFFLILLTVRDSAGEVVTGLQAGANDYVTKPFNQHELLVRVRIGARMLELQAALAQRVRDLESALADVKTLTGLLPICAYCKKIRDDKNYWHQVELYVSEHTDVRFSHGICPDCLKTAEAEIDVDRRARQDPPAQEIPQRASLS
jgi:CheY-like chemotaxis protein